MGNSYSLQGSFPEPLNLGRLRALSRGFVVVMQRGLAQFLNPASRYLETCCLASSLVDHIELTQDMLRYSALLAVGHKQRIAMRMRSLAAQAD